MATTSGRSLKWRNPIMKKLLIIASAALLVSGVAQARDQIRVVGSSTVYPFTTVVAELFGNIKGKTPIIESTGTGGGFKLFCSGIGDKYADFNNASRAMKKSEVKKCAKNGITATEIKVGYDGIVLANSKQSKRMEISLKEIFLALAAKIPQDGKLVSNPYTHWNQINPKLPNTKIRVLGPPPTSGTRDAFVELAMEGGAKKFGWLKDLRKKDKKKFKAIAHTIREDGAYVEAGENDNLIIKKLDSDPSSFGVFGFSFLDQNLDKLQGSVIQGVTPTFDSIADGSYKVSRPLFIYAKDQHMGKVPGMKDFIKLYISEQMTGEEGRLADGGLIPLPAREKAELVKKLFAALQ